MHFQVILLLIKFSWVESIVRANNKIEQVRCKVCSIIEMKVQSSSCSKVWFLAKTCMPYETKGDITKWSFNWRLVLLK
jgi:hypothetical protein